MKDVQGAAAGSSCEVPREPRRLVESCVIRHDGVGWEGVPAVPYKADGASFEGVKRRVLAAPESASFETRYFEIDPGGHSTYEWHDHVHVVVCMRGCGRVRLGADESEVGFGDVVYVAPGEPHQFSNPYGAPFGFLCIVDRDRDRPVAAGG